MVEPKSNAAMPSNPALPKIRRPRFLLLVALPFGLALVGVAVF
jgi:hypothetical protein